MKTLAPSPARCVAIYARTASRHIDGMWLEQQTKPLKRLVAEHANWELTAIYADAGIPACQHRPQLEAMLHDCESGSIDVVITASASRLSRDIDGLRRIMARLVHSNTKLILHQEGISLDDPIIHLMRAVISGEGGITV